MRRGTAYTLVAAALWGTTFPVIGYALREPGTGPYSLVFYRFLVAAVALGAWVWVRRVPWTQVIREPALWALGALNALGYATQFVAQEHTTATKTSLLVDIDVVAVAVLGYWLLGERHSRALLAALVLGALGIVLLTTDGDPANVSFGRGEFTGDALAFGAGLVWAAYFVGVKRYLATKPGADGVAMLFVILASTTLLLALPAFVLEGASEVGTSAAWGATVYLGSAATVGAFYLWQEALRTEGVTATSVLLLLEIVVAVALGVAWLGERLGRVAAMGAALIVAAAYLASREDAGPKRVSTTSPDAL